MAAPLPYPNLYENNNLAPSPPIDPTTTPILDPYTRGYMAQGIQQGQLWDIVTPQGYEAEAQRRTGLLREAIVPAAEQTLARGLEDVRSTMQRGGKLSSSAAIKQQMRTSELYGAQVAGTMAQGTLGIYEQLGTERGAELNRMLASGTTETGAIQQMYQTRTGLASQERITQIQENTRTQIAQIQASTELNAQEKQYQIAQLQATAQKETATITGTLGLTGTKYTADVQRQIADVQTQMQRQITQIEADTTLTVEEKRAAIANLQFASQEKIANIQATAQRETATISGEFGLAGTKYSADVQRQIADVQTQMQRQIAIIEADTTLTVEDKRAAVAQLQMASQERITNIQAAAQVQMATIGAAAQVEVAGINYKGTVYSADKQEAIAQIQADTSLTIEDKRTAVAMVQIKSSESIAQLQTTTQKEIANIEASTTLTVEDKRAGVANLQMASNERVNELQTQTQRIVADVQTNAQINIAGIEASTTLSVADKQILIAAENNRTQVAISDIKSTSDKYGVDVGLQVAGVQTEAQKTIAQIQADTTLTVAKKEQKTALTQIAASERIADVQAQAQITATTIAGTLAGQASRDVAGIGAEADRYKTDADKIIATVQSNTALSIADKEQATAQIKITAETNIALDNIRSAETINAANNAKDTAITNLNNSAAKSIADIQANTALSVEDKRAAVENIKVQAQLSISAAENASREKSVLAEIAGSKDIAEINTKSNELMATARNNSDQAIAILDANNRLSLADKEMLKTQEITRSNETIANIEATSVIARIQGEKDVARIQKNAATAVQTLQNSGAKRIAEINGMTTLSAADKQIAIAKINNQTQLAISNTESRTALGIADKGIIEARTVADIQTKSAEKMNLINARKDMNINALQLRNDLTLAEKEKERTRIITESNEDIAATNNLSAETIANAQIAGQKDIADLSLKTQRYISDNSITEATTVANIQALSNEKITVLNKLRDEALAKVNATTSLKLSEKETERTKINAQTDKDIADIQTTSAETIAWKQAGVAMALGRISDATQRYIANAGLTEQVREFDAVQLAEKAKDINTYQRQNPITGIPETVSEPWAVTIAREQMAQELSKFNKTEMGKDENGNDVPRWQLELKARTKETMVDYVDENGVPKSVPMAYAIAQDQFDNIITTTDMNNDANWDMLGRQIDEAQRAQIMDANTTRSVAANALAQRAKESDDLVDQQQYQNMVDLITNPAVVAYMEKNPAKDIMGEGIIALMKGAFTGEGITINAEQLIARMQEYEIITANKEELDTAFDKFETVGVAPGVVPNEESFIKWADKNPREAGLVARYYFSRTGKDAPAYIKKYEEVGMTPEEQENRAKLKELYGTKPTTPTVETLTGQITPFVETNPNLEVTMT